ncbi:uncharacterized protein LOC126902848 [Daktulosphaira vitifoliae]|uniref:uncharacterized protein LOC126902848 n=1 Tax=Daktulosphaira vitifoliae TaxID=58002 RepID=UPI0021AA190A|nr:uncharacterized protein LOC126902848 [Daktulosphaira vitifoliae]XP_050536471.1 uncharacterized protein LOC126902848 [Daktulosphaira vitifoliae]XP_050536472.1 uncharacterized protein LOC126902848 [Daktulosphaira vitifoliae]
MNFFSEIHIVLLEIIITNIIIAYTKDEFSQNSEKHISITISDLNKLVREYPAFLKLTLQKQEYYTGKDVSRCPMHYNENTILDYPDLAQSKNFNHIEHTNPWTWTQNNETDVPVPIDNTIGQKLGSIIKPCIKNNFNIIQCYTQYLNVIESVGITLVDRFCLFELEVWSMLDKLEASVDYKENFSLFNITLNTEFLTLIIDVFKILLNNISFAFKRYDISTLPLDCVSNVMGMFSTEGDEFQENFLKCRELMKSKRNYAILDNDQYWEWNITSDCKPDNGLLCLEQHKNNDIGLNLFAFNEYN